MALSFALSFAVLLSAVLPVPVQSSYCASTCAVHVTQPILFFVANAPNHIPGLSRKPLVDPHRIGQNLCIFTFYLYPFKLRANLFKNQADLYWRVIYDPLGFFGVRVDRRIPNFQVPRPNGFFSRAIKKI